MSSNYKLLLNKSILAILDGDTIIEEKDNYQVKMPYLSGPELCELCNKFGLYREYGKESRWVYLHDLINYLIEKNRCGELLLDLFSKQNFTNLLNLKTPEEVDSAYTYIIEATINKINVILFTTGSELQCIKGNYYIVEIGKEPVIEAPNIKLINLQYVHELKERCTEDFLAKNYDSVITKSRTMIEEILIYILEQNGIEIETKGDINKIYNQVKTLYNMRQDKSYAGSVNGLLSGLEKIVQSVAEMRNSNSDAHGVGNNRIVIREHEARLVMNSTISFCEYILEIYKYHK